MAETVATLRTRAKTLADLTDSSFVSDAEWIQFAQDGCRALYDIFVSLHEDEFETTTTTALVSGTTDYSLPADFMKLLNIDYLEQGGADYVPVQRYDKQTAAYLENSVARYGWNGTAEHYYAIRGDKIRILPAPTGGTIRLRYIPVCPTLDEATDVLPNIRFDHWSTFIVWYMVANAQQKEESDPSFAMAKMTEIQNRIIAVAGERDRHMPLQIQAVTPNRGW